jgi:hypothetical protein
MYKSYTRKLQAGEYHIELRFEGDLINEITTNDSQLYDDCFIYKNKDYFYEHELEMFDTYEELIEYIIELK